MSTVRHLFAIVITTVSAGLLTLMPTSAAWAMLPPVPDPGGSGSSPTKVGVTSAAGGMSTWQVASITAACTALAVVTILAVFWLLRSDHQGTGHTARA